jgi:30S ribosomal protein S31
MGKGDVKTKRGKIINGSYGVTRPSKKKKITVNTEKKVENQKK